MAIVGEAHVEIHTITKSVAGEIRDGLRDAIRGEGDKTGKQYGDEFGKSSSDSITNATSKITDRISRQFSDAGSAAGKAFEGKFTAFSDRISKSVIAPKADTSKLEKALETAEKKLDALVNKKNSMNLDLDIRTVEAKIQQIVARIDELNKKPKSAKIDADIALAEANLARLNAQLDALNREKASPKIDADIANAERDVQKIRDAIASVTDKDHKVRVSGDNKSFVDLTNSIALLQRSLATLSLPVALTLLAPQILSLGTSFLDLLGILYTVPAAMGTAGLAVGTLLVGFHGLTDALGPTGTPAQLKKVNEALAALSPQARATALAVRGFGDDWKALQGAVQDRLFLGISGDVTQLGNIALPILKRAMVDIAAAYNAAAHETMAFWESAKGTANFQIGIDNSSLAVQNLAKAFTPVMKALSDIFAVGSTYLPQFTAWVAGLAEKWSAFIETAAATGKIKESISGAIDVIKGLGDITGNVGGILKSMFDAATQSGADLVGVVGGLSQVVDDFLNTDIGQAGLVAIFKALNDVVAGLSPGLVAVGDAVAKGLVALGPALGPTAQAISDIAISVAPLITDLASLASVVLPPLVSVVSTLAPLLGPVAAGLAAAWAATTLFSGISAITGAIVSFTIAQGVMSATAAASAGPLTLLSGAIRAVGIAIAANPIGIIITALVAVGAALVYAYNHFEGFRNVVDSVFGFIKDVAVSIGQWFAGPFVDFFKSAFDFVVGVFTSVKNFISEWGGVILAVLMPFVGIPLLIINNWDTIKQFFIDLWNNVVSTITGAVSSIGQFMSELWTNITSGISTAFSAVVDFLANLPNNIAHALGFLIGSLVRIAIDAAVAFKDAIVTGFNATIDFFVNLPGMIVDGLASLGSFLLDVAINAGTAMRDGFVTAFEATVQFFTELPGRIMSFLTSLGTTLRDAAVAAWDGFTNGLSTAWNATVSWITGLPGKIASFFTGMASDFASWATTAWNGFTQGLSDAWNGTVSFLSELPGRVGQFFADAGSWLLDVGGNIIDGLLNGLAAAGKAVWDFFVGLVDSFVSGFKEALGISSPSTLFAQFGQWILEGLLNGLKALVDMVLNFVTGFVDAIVSGFRSFVDTVVSLWNGFWNGLSSVVGTVFDGIRSFIEGVFAAVKMIFDTFIALVTGDWGAFWDGIKMIGETFLNGLATLFGVPLTAIQTLWNTVWGAISTFFTTVWNGITTFVTNLWIGIQTQFTTALTAIQTVFTTVLTFIQTLWNTVWTAVSTVFTTIWNAIVAFVTAVWTGIQTQFTTFLTAIQTVFTTVLTFIQNLWNTVWTAISTFFTTIWNAIVSFVSAVWTGIQTQFTTFLTTVQTLWTTVWTAISTFFSSIWNSITTFFTSTLTALQNLWNTVWNAISNVFTTIWNAIVSFITSVWSGIQAQFQAFLTFIQNLWTTVWNAVSSFFSTIWNAISSTAQSIWNAISSFLQSGLNAFSSFWSSIWNAISSFFSSIWSAIQAAVTAVWNAIQSFLQAGLSALQSLFQTIMSAISTAWNTAWGAVRDAATTIWNAISSFFTNGLNAFKTFWSNTWTSVVDGFKSVFNGVVGIATDIWNNVKKIFADGVNAIIGGVNWPIDKINGLFGISIPTIPTIQLATGGSASDSLAGKVKGIGGRTADRVPAALSYDEHVWSAQEVAGAGGHAGVRRLREMARQGMLKGFADGGEVTPRDIPDFKPGAFIVNDVVAEPAKRFLDALNSGQAEALQATGGRFARMPGFAAGGAIAAGAAFAAGENGKPYIWGGVGPQGYDCSGFMSAITNVLLGQAPHSRRGVAAGVPWPGFTSGLNGSWTMGGSSVHTAGTLAGTNAESGGSHGNVAWGGPATGSSDSQFPNKATLPEVGGMFVDGGGGGGIFDPAAWFDALASGVKEMAIEFIRSVVPDVPSFMEPIGVGTFEKAWDGLRDFAIAAIKSLLGIGDAPAAPGANTQTQTQAVAGMATGGHLGQDHNRTQYGWDKGQQWSALSELIRRESGFSDRNEGIFAKSRDIYGAAEKTPAAQSLWGLEYIKQVHGNPLKALQTLNRIGHYDRGGWLQPGMTAAINGTGKKEAVIADPMTTFEKSFKKIFKWFAPECRDALVDGIGSIRGWFGNIFGSHGNGTGQTPPKTPNNPTPVTNDPNKLPTSPVVESAPVVTPKTPIGDFGKAFSDALKQFAPELQFAISAGSGAQIKEFASAISDNPERLRAISDAVSESMGVPVDNIGSVLQDLIKSVEPIAKPPDQPKPDTGLLAAFDQFKAFVNANLNRANNAGGRLGQLAPDIAKGLYAAFPDLKKATQTSKIDVNKTLAARAGDILAYVQTKSVDEQEQILEALSGQNYTLNKFAADTASTMTDASTTNAPAVTVENGALQVTIAGNADAVTVDKLQAVLNQFGEQILHQYEGRV